MGDAGVVDKNIEALESAAGGTKEGIDRVGIADIARVSEDFNLCGRQFPADAG
jgi:hypothetical protein